MNALSFQHYVLLSHIFYTQFFLMNFNIHAYNYSPFMLYNKRHSEYYTACRILYCMPYIIQHAVYYTACLILYCMPYIILHAIYYTACSVMYFMPYIILHAV